MEFSDQELLTYMKLAHEQDITFNQLVERALREAIEREGITV
jgi:predicted HicB family RNase H-like nuclease